MRTRSTLHPMALAAAMVLALVVASSPPAGATPRPNTASLVSGRLGLNGFMNIDVPPLAPCSSMTLATSTEDSIPTTNNMSATLTIGLVFSFPAGSGTYYQLAATTATPGAVGDHVISTGAFSGLAMTGTFALRNYNAITCTIGTTMCVGNVALTAGGQSLSTTLPWPVGTDVKVNASGTVSNVSPSCPFPFNLIFRNGGTIALGDNPDDCYLYPMDVPQACFPNGPDNAAIFDVTA